MTDFDTIWRTQDEIRTVVNAVLGECIWNLSYNERRMAIELVGVVGAEDGSRVLGLQHGGAREVGSIMFVYSV